MRSDLLRESQILTYHWFSFSKFRCFEIEESVYIDLSSFKLSKVNSRRFIVDIMINDIFPKKLSSSSMTSILNQISHLPFPWMIPEIESFLESFFFEYLRNSTDNKNIFDFNSAEHILKIFLRRGATRFSRLKRLVELYGNALLLNKFIQTLILLSGEHRSFIDALLESNKAITLRSLIDENSPFLPDPPSWRFNLDGKFPGLYLDVLSIGFRKLTGNQQKKIAQIILDDYIRVKT